MPGWVQMASSGALGNGTLGLRATRILGVTKAPIPPKGSSRA